MPACILDENRFVARYGGEEFAAVLPNTDEGGAAVVAGNILDAIRGLKIPHEKSEAARHVTISIGATTLRPKEGEKYMDYINKADEALYHTKRWGRNGYTYVNYEENEI